MGNRFNRRGLDKDAAILVGIDHARSPREMAESAKSSSRLPDTSGETVRQRWLDLLDLSYSTRRVTHQEIEPGVHAVIVPAACRRTGKHRLIDVDVRVAESHVPGMARGVRLALDHLGEFGLSTATDYHGWMGPKGKDIAAGETQVTVFVDLAYLEGALLAHLWDHGVLVDFNSPLSFFRRGALTDYANIYEAVVRMVADGRSLAETADQLAAEVLRRLQLYANTYHQLSSLYGQGVWQIDHDSFVLSVPGTRLSLAIQYWELQGDHISSQRSVLRWRRRIESFLEQSLSELHLEVPKSFAA